MKTILFKAPAALILGALLMSIFTSVVHADSGVTASPSATPVMTTVTRQEVVCDTTMYGVTNCRTIVREIPVHVTQNTGLPMVSALGFAFLSIAGGSFYLLGKK